jgi:quinol monooxygenase YgiN
MGKTHKKKVYLTGHIDVPADRMQSVLAALPEHISRTRAEVGNISFDVTPCAQVTGRLLVSESFVDQAAFDFHQARTKASAWAAVTKGIARAYRIRTET